MIKRKWSFMAALYLALGGVASISGIGHAAATISDGTVGCNALAKADFSTLQDASTQIVEAKVVAAGDGKAAYCKVTGYVAPQVGFELQLPLSGWNGKFIEIGCGGFCGNLDWTFWCPLHRGYACIVSDMGHRGEGGLWGFNNLQAQIDFGYRATHVTALAGKAIVTRYYSKAPFKSLMMGCSTGGYQGMVEAQRFPWDFDGIVSISPDMESQADLTMRTAWLLRNLLEQNAHPVFRDIDLQLLHEAALAKCDTTDGVKDGVVGDPVGCHFDPSVLACRAGQASSCLSARQIVAARNVYSGPTTSGGRSISTRGPFAGSELRWNGFEVSWTIEYEDFFRYLLTSGPLGPNWKWADLDFDHDYQRLGLGALYTDNNPDLRRFKTAGGKLLLALGGNEVAEQPGAAVDYYETVERTMGGRASTQSFFRLYVVPGMDHCSGGDGAFAIDYLTYMENWAERGQAPDKLIGAHVDTRYLADQARRGMPQRDSNDTSEPSEDLLAWSGAIGLKFPLDATIPISFSRPIFPYPLLAKYKGTGDPNKTDSFVPVEPESSNSTK